MCVNELRRELLGCVFLWLFYGNGGRVTHCYIDIGEQLLAAENELAFVKALHGIKQIYKH